METDDINPMEETMESVEHAEVEEEEMVEGGGETEQDEISSAPVEGFPEENKNEEMDEEDDACLVIDTRDHPSEGMNQVKH